MAVVKHLKRDEALIGCQVNTYATCFAADNSQMVRAVN